MIAHRLAEKLTPLRQVFHETGEMVTAISAPPSLQQARDRYIEMLALYELSATEMLEVTRDGDNRHLIDAQAKKRTCRGRTGEGRGYTLAWGAQAELSC